MHPLSACAGPSVFAHPHDMPIEKALEAPNVTLIILHEAQGAGLEE